MRSGTPDFVGARLREAREARGLAGATLAELIGVSRQAVSQYERRGLTPAPPVMARICTVLAMPYDYFLSPSRERIGTLFFRSFASATKTERTKQYQRQKWRRRIVSFLGRYLTFPPVRTPALYSGDPRDLSAEDVEAFATKARRHLGLGDGPITNIVLLLENHGAIIVRTPFQARTLDAFSEWSEDDGRPYFVLNADKRSAARSRFDVAHELAHMFMHRHLQSASHPAYRQQLEGQAHRFAGAFLAPAAAFKRVFHARSVDELVDLKQRWGLAIAALVRRACDLQLITPSQYRRMMTSIGQRGWRTREPLDDTLEPEKPRLLRRSVDVLLRERIVRCHALARIGAGSLRDVEAVLGLPQCYLDPDPHDTLRFEPGTSKQPPADGTAPRIIRLARHLDP
jgi:Zn-dependent peptidase ImmA (M78 family)/transcriptional regulator with XRE-family HTH domain